MEEILVTAREPSLLFQPDDRNDLVGNATHAKPAPPTPTGLPRPTGNQWGWGWAQPPSGSGCEQPQPGSPWPHGTPAVLPSAPFPPLFQPPPSLPLPVCGSPPAPAAAAAEEEAIS